MAVAPVRSVTLQVRKVSKGSRLLSGRGPHP
jgi:hypothetical protein